MLRIAAVGLGNRTCKYLGYVKSHPEKVRLVAVAEPEPVRMQAVKNDFSLSDEVCFSSLQDLLSSDIQVDAVIIGTPDGTHYEFADSCLSKGWHVLLEKPAALTDEQCLALVEKAAACSLNLCICYVLRYHPYYRALKTTLDSASLGKMTSVKHVINIGRDRMAHTFVRGLWSKEAESSPIILSKASHDIDLLHWLVGKPFVNITSFGSLSRYISSNAPETATYRCIDCPLEEKCPYSAVDLYLRRKDWIKGFLVSPGESLTDAICRELREGRYGRCVYKCDNDVLDYQELLMETEGGCRLRMVVDGLTAEDSRVTVFEFEEGRVIADGKKIMLERYSDSSIVETDLSEYAGGPLHSGADMLIVEDFLTAVSEGRMLKGIDMASAYHSHHICFLAEKVRK